MVGWVGAVELLCNELNCLVGQDRTRAMQSSRPAPLFETAHLTTHALPPVLTRRRRLAKCWGAGGRPKRRTGGCPKPKGGCAACGAKPACSGQGELGGKDGSAAPPVRSGWRKQLTTGPAGSQ